MIKIKCLLYCCLLWAYQDHTLKVLCDGRYGGRKVSARDKMQYETAVVPDESIDNLKGPWALSKGWMQWTRV